MTRKQAERIMQMDVVELPSAPLTFRFEGHTDGILVRGRGRTANEALHKLVDNNYKRVCALVAQQQKYRCGNVALGGEFGCGLIRPLQFHHIVPRSKGRVDTELSLVGLCRECHAEKHGEKKRRV